MTHLFIEGEPLETWGAEVMPEGLIWKNAPHHILEVANRWRVHTRWWEPRETILREYLKVVTDLTNPYLGKNPRPGYLLAARLLIRPARRSKHQR